MDESVVIFEVREDEADGGFTARALGHSIFPEADSLEDLRRNVREAADCYFEDEASAPKAVCARQKRRNETSLSEGSGWRRTNLAC